MGTGFFVVGTAKKSHILPACWSLRFDEKFRAVPPLIVSKASLVHQGQNGRLKVNTTHRFVHDGARLYLRGIVNHKGDLCRCFQWNPLVVACVFKTHIPVISRKDNDGIIKNLFVAQNGEDFSNVIINAFDHAKILR